MREHQSGCFLPMGILIGFSIGWSHGSSPCADRSVMDPAGKSEGTPLTAIERSPRKRTARASCGSVPLLER
jgi:hypothetical protein